MKRTSYVVLLQLCLFLAPVLAGAKVTCSNSTEVATLGYITTYEPGTLPTLTFVLAGYGTDTNQCVTSPSHCKTVPCAMARCTDIPYSTGSCLQILESACGTETETVRQVQFVATGACP